MIYASRVTVVFAAVLTMSIGVSRGAVIDVDTVIGPDYPFQQETITVVDGIQPPTEVTILDGVLLGTPSGPSVDIALELLGVSRAAMQGGIIQGSTESVAVRDHASFHMVGGEIIFRPIVAHDNSRVVIDAGQWENIQSFDSSRVQINGGGPLGHIYSLKTFGDSHAVINDSGLDALADDTSSIVVNFGRFESFRSLGNSEVLIKGGGYTTGIRALEASVVHIRGLDDDLFSEPLRIENSAVVHVYGTGLHFDVVPDPDIQINVVRGTWADGSEALFRYRLFDQGQIILHEVPEPTAAALLALGAASMLVWRRAHFAALTRSAAKHR
ncbi:MAG: PEP-CTERM sorting domain-containing protein [Planctomycetia bacterium]|nr:PEP-CTERM sorting domain-containing protein [Planctomycetia bacterium]